MSRTYEEVAELVTSLGYRCTPKFAEPLLGDEREKLLFGGWRAAKTFRECLDCLLHILDWYVEYGTGKGRSRLVWIVGPDYKQTAEEYRYLSEWLDKLGLLADRPSLAIEGPRQLRLSFGVLIETKSADRPETLASVAPDYILACESGQFDEEVRNMLRGRAGEKNAPLMWGGTVEDDEGHIQWAWYQELARDWLDNPTRRHRAWELPTWDNPLWYSCLSWIEDDESLAVYCPDSNHGEAHGGRLHPIIKQWEETLPPDVFSRRIAATATGIRDAIYYQTQKESYLLPIPQTALKSVFMTTGGIDYGWADHPTTLAIIQYVQDPRDLNSSFSSARGIGWVREVRYLDSDPGDSIALKTNFDELSKTWNCSRWNVDPMQVYLAKSFDSEIQTTTASEIKREARIGLISGRLNYHKLFFDLSGPGVKRAYEEFKRYHRRKTRTGKLEVVRRDDDGVAAIEDANEAFDGTPRLHLPRKQRVSPSIIRRVRPKQEFARQT